MDHVPSVDDLDARLKEFVDRHIHGWSDAEWSHLLASLTAEGHDVADPHDLGLRLERAHILATLERLAVPGVGPQRSLRLADTYPRLWQLRQASVEELAAIPTFHRALAERLHDALMRRTGGF